MSGYIWVTVCRDCARMQRILSCGVLLSVLIFAAAQNALTEDDNEELLDAHNSFRGMVNPSASNMLRMVSYKLLSSRVIGPIYYQFYVPFEVVAIQDCSVVCYNVSLCTCAIPI